MPLALTVPAVLVLATSPRAAAAHPDHGPTLGERSLSLELHPSGAKLVYGLTFTDRFGLKLRLSADADRDGRLDDSERSRAASALAASVREGCRLLLDGTEVQPTWAEPYLGPAEGPIRPDPLAFELTGRVPLAGGRHRVTIEDRTELEGIYRTAVRIRAEPGVDLVAAGRGWEPSRLERSIVILDLPSPTAPPPRVVTAEVVLPGAGESPAPVSAPVVVATVVAIALLTVGLWGRLRRGPGRPERRPEPKRRAARGRDEPDARAGGDRATEGRTGSHEP